MNEDVIIQQMSLLLMQMRYTRRAFEDIERSTARYGGVNFSSALSAGARFGEPPLYNGALKVHVVNISDLNPGTGLGELIQGVLSGLGGFLGNFGGGLIGGTASGAALPWMLLEIRLITQNINRILEQMNIIRGPGGSRPDTSSSGSGIDLNQWTTTMTALANLFRAASGGSGSQIAGDVPENWLVMLYTSTRLVEALAHLVDGLIIMLPILVGGLAFLITHFDTIKQKLLDFFQFLLRNIFLVRGVVLVTLYDLLAGAAGLAADIVGILNRAITTMLNALFAAIGTLLNASVEVFRFVSGGLERSMNALMEWLRTGLGTFLLDLGRSDVFRLLHHLLRVLPLILPSLVVLVRNHNLTDGQVDMLKDAAKMTLPGTPLVGGMPATTPFPNLQSLGLPAAETTRVTELLRDAQRSSVGQLSGGMTVAERGLRGMQTRIQQEATSASGLFASDTDQRLIDLRNRAGELVSALIPPAAQERPKTGLEAIANAYEEWLTKGGFAAVMARLEDHFRRSPTVGTETERTLIGRIVAGSSGAAEPPTATIRIERLEIEVQPAQTDAATDDSRSSDLRDMEDRLLESDFVTRFQEQVRRRTRDLDDRGGNSQLA